MNADEQLRGLREARAEVDRLKASVQLEMREKAEQGVLWSNRQCKDWDAYTQAHVHLQEVRAEIES